MGNTSSGYSYRCLKRQNVKPLPSRRNGESMLEYWALNLSFTDSRCPGSLERRLATKKLGSMTHSFSPSCFSFTYTVKQRHRMQDTEHSDDFRCFSECPFPSVQQRISCQLELQFVKHLMLTQTLWGGFTRSQSQQNRIHPLKDLTPRDLWN